MTRPHFLPPERRLTNMTTARGIRAAVPFWAMCVATGRVELLTAYAAIHAAYTKHVWRGDAARLARFETGLLAALSDAVERAQRVAADINQHETWMAQGRVRAEADGVAETVWLAELEEAA